MGTLGQGLEMPFVIPSLPCKALLVLFWGSLGADSTAEQSTVVLFSEGTSVRYFWQLTDMLSAIPGDSWLPLAMAHLSICG
jgi:hypothetical protein